MAPDAHLMYVRRNSMNRHRFHFLIASAMIPLALAQTIGTPPDARARVDKIFERFNRTDSPGCAVGAAIGATTVLSAGYGMADLEHNVPITPESIFEAGSVSKQFTAGAVLLLAGQGKLSLDDPARDPAEDVCAGNPARRFGAPVQSRPVQQRARSRNGFGGA
jgi:CubicO group peptidase (beta-lactamase class C family)